MSPALAIEAAPLTIMVVRLCKIRSLGGDFAMSDHPEVQ